MRIPLLAQQFFAQFLITIVLLASVSALFMPNRAQAGTLVFETNPNIIVQVINDLLKEFGLDGVAFAIASQILNNMANQALNWVATGQTPSFVQDWQGFLSSAGGLAYTTFTSGTSSYFATKILPKVPTSSRTLLQTYVQNPFNPLEADLTRLAQSTLQAYGVSPGMITTYARDFQSGGGWRTFEALSQPNNSFYNTYLQVINAQGRAIASAVEANKTQVLAGDGFTDKKDPLTGKTKTPGSTVKSTVDNATKAPSEKISTADEIQEFVTVILLTAFNRILTRGLQ